MSSPTLIREFLDKLERQEVELLTWGIVDGGFSEAELEELTEDFLNSHQADEETWDFLDELIEERRVLFEFNFNGRRLFRTRLGESIRLFSRLRQLFPRNNENWEIAPTLVADYRLQVRPRVYPKRNLSPDLIIENVKNKNLLTPVRESAILQILNASDRGTISLSDFQLRATVRMLGDLKSQKSKGMIVCAQTGTGKTLSFYLPALTRISELLKKGEYWTKGLGIYPRNELLKDQFSDTYQEARRLDTFLLKQGKRKICIGAFFGLTPRRKEVEKIKEKWEAKPDGFICPYLRCPKCEGELLWKQADIKAGKENLHCVNSSCEGKVLEDEVILTRDRAARTPPDLLFTTTEMLNRTMADSRYGHVFGIAANKQPQMVLLDEVHTYTGVHGAQVAYLLRRWQKLIERSVHFTGLSATLENAEEFFTELTGLTPGSILEITPTPEDLIPEGMEYQLILRGDPVSGTSLLSTSIQTAMLLRRVLDPATIPVSQGLYGSRIFAFTDDLDVTNRLFHNLLDAEGRDSWGRPLPNRPPLAGLRVHNPKRFRDGQSWYLCEEIGHRLQTPLNIGRTSSQDTGITANADVIVATASLEVGFNDPTVGGVLQHKAPRNMASFLQRKGRGGRKRTMRPWTVVVLSDYGRDRVAYQNYDRLFSPILEKRSLPITNRYVIRMQAVFAFMDWIAKKLSRFRDRGNVWNDFSAPLPYRTIQNRQQQEIKVIKKVLATQEGEEELATYLQSALCISEEEVQAILWEPPRSLMLSVLPTLLRRLESGWKRLKVHPQDSDQDYQVPFSPLPDFIPANLFSDLLLPEVTITTPPQTRNSDPDINPMPILQALKAFAPGRASRRFGIEHIYATHWFPPPNLHSEEQNLAIETYCTEYEELGNFQMWQDGKVAEVRCIRPWAIHPEQVPGEIAITSNAQLEWCSQIIPYEQGLRLELPKNLSWHQLLEEVRCFTHSQQCPVEVRRFAIASHANLRFERGGELNAIIRFTDNNRGWGGIGFTQSVDGLVFRLRLPETLQVNHLDNSEKARSLRTAYFRHCILTDSRLDKIANIFQRDWLYQIYLSLLTATALSENISLPQALTSIQNQGLGEAMGSVLDNIFQSLNVEETFLETEEEAVEETNDTQRRQRVQERLLDLCHQEEVQTVLNDRASVLWSNPDENWYRWVEWRFKATLGGALLEACSQLCPQFDTLDLILDIDPGVRPTHAVPLSEGQEEIWITESTLGGGGVIEEIARRYASDPAHFFRLVRSAIDPSDFEIIDAELTRFLDLSQTSPTVQDSISQVRSAEGYKPLKQASEYLQRTLTNEGGLVTPTVITAIFARILRPGSNADTDHLLWRLIHTWREEEERLGIEIDGRVFAYIQSREDDLDQALGHLGLTHATPYWRFQVIYGLLWARGNSVRSRALSSYNPFTPLPEAERELLLDVLPKNEQEIRLEEENPNWREQVETIFQQGKSVMLVSSQRQVLTSVILELLAEPIELGFLQVYPQVEGIQRDARGFGVKVTVREGMIQ